jgi:hypothetical protein
MHKKVRTFEQKRRVYILLTGAAISVIVAACLTVLLVRHSNDTPARASAITVQQVPQPATALQIAEKVGCTNFQDEGPSEAGGAIDTGTCYIGSHKYGVDTFPTKSVRDSWLQLAEPMGVSPKWETDTSVVYPSTDS